MLNYYSLSHVNFFICFSSYKNIFIVCIPVSIKSQVKRNTPTLTILRTITERSLKLIGVGVILNTKGGPVLFKELRLPGVLQRFGICYFVIAATVLMCASKDFVNNRKAVSLFSLKKYFDTHAPRNAGQ